VACREVERTVPGATVLSRDGGAILLTIGDEGDPRPLLDLHGVDDLLAEIIVLHGIARGRDLLALLAEAIGQSSALEEAVAVRWAYRQAQKALTPTVRWADVARFAAPWGQARAPLGSPAGEATGWPIRGKPSFRVTARVEGRRAVLRGDAQGMVVRSLARRFPSWVHGPQGDADLQFVVWIWDSGCRLALRLVEPGFARRPWKVAHIPASLPPSIAYGLVATAGPRAGERVLDPFCGAATILVERGLVGPPPAGLLGADLSAAARRAATANGAAARVDIAVHEWDATALPLAAASIDTIITNPPYGQRHGPLLDLPALYGGFLSEAGRVLRRGGLCVVLTSQTALLEQLLSRRAEFAWRGRLAVDVLGVAAYVHLLERAASPA
jgi:SAM-dependent methyltransferase